MIQYEKEIINFFEKYLDKNNEAITGREFFCPFGLTAALKKKLLIIIFDNEKIVASVRFYPRKRDHIVSVYQFAINENYRGQSLLKKMLSITGFKTFEILCPLNSKFNEYYKKTSWQLTKVDEKYNYRGLSLK